MLYYIINLGDFMKWVWVIRIIVAIALIFVAYYNVMVRKSNKVKNALSSIDVMFKRRNDLIPNLVNTVKGYMNYEEECLARVISLRNSINENNSSKLNNEMSYDIKELLATAEAYPNLKANEQFLKLQKALYDMEEIISAARRTYNTHVTSFNTFISMFPNILFAKIFGFKEYELFKVEKEAREGKIYYNGK